MKGLAAVRNGPDGDFEMASPMQCISGLTPASSAE